MEMKAVPALPLIHPSSGMWILNAASFSLNFISTDWPSGQGKSQRVQEINEMSFLLEGLKTGFSLSTAFSCFPSKQKEQKVTPSPYFIDNDRCFEPDEDHYEVEQRALTQTTCDLWF